jgi:ABC-type sugar transport system ATPase subunit
MTSVQLRQVVKEYDSVDQVTLAGYKLPPALREVSLEVKDGETMCVIGPSGCGKSTLLKVVAGLEFPQTGHVFYGNFDMTEIKPQDRGVGMVFQDYALYPTMKGKGNLAYYFQQHEHTQKEMEERVQETAKLMGVDFELLLGRTTDTLSGGEKQRVAIARCIVRDPVVFLMDEPIVNLDAKRREQTRIEIKKLLRKFHITTLYVTHDQQEAVFMGDRIAVMRDGIIEQVGTFDDLYYTPANLFVATFVGSPPISLLPAEIAERRIILNDHVWDLPENLAGVLKPGKVRVGVRPENWLLSGSTSALLQVSHIERMPTERASFIHGLFAGTNVVVLTSLEQPETALIQATPDWEHALFFAGGGEEGIYTPGIPEFF